MPIDILALLKAVADAGGWAVACTICIFVAGLLIRGALVPAPFYKRETQRADRAEARLERASRLLSDRQRVTRGTDAADR